MSSVLPPLDEKVARLHVVDPAILDAPGRREHYLAWLTPEERERAASFRRPADRDLSLGARALCRSTLSDALGVDPREPRFRTASRGRPELASPCDGLNFNLSHTRGVIAGAFARSVAVGVDVERLREGVDLAIARRYFSPTEADRLERLSADQARVRFFELWTLKEAWLKARGDGLAHSLALSTLTLGEAGSLAFQLHDGSGEAARWRFALFAPETDLRLALALRVDDEAEEWSWSCHRLVPGESCEAWTPEIVAASPGFRPE